MVLKKKELKIVENELELERGDKTNWHNIVIAVEAVASGALLLGGNAMASIIMLSIIPTALLSIRKSKQINFKYTEAIARQARVSEDKMNRLSYDDFAYIVSMGKHFEKKNISADDLKEFAVSMKYNSLRYIRQDISNITYKKNKKKIEKALIKKSKSHEKQL